MGESKKDALRVNFDRKLKLEFHGMKVTSDAGLIAYREIDDVFGLTDNQVRLQLFALAYNLGNFLRRLALPKKIKDWSFRTLQTKLIKIGAKVVKRSRYVIFQMAEVLVSKSLFREILERIHRLKPVPIGSG